MHTVEVSLGSRSYPVLIGAGAIDTAPWQDLLPQRRVLVVSNEVVAPLYLDQLKSALQGMDVASVILPDGEATKTIDNWSLILDHLAAMQAGRDVCLVALGGGVIGDICGFAAAAWMRGVPFVQVPTTLLAQVDSSVGGKTAVNHPKGKNLVGAFHQPVAVMADTNTLDTLPEREFRAGMAEVIKCGAINDAAFFDWIELNVEPILERDAETLATLIGTAVLNKARIVAEDEREAGARALLNLGHTFGHALETVTGYREFLHGEAVAAGMVMAARLSEARGLCKAGLSACMAHLLQRFDLPVTLPPHVPSEAMLDAMALDKKVLAGRQRLVLLEAIGGAIIDSESSAADILNCLEQSRDE
jgi:3-dehydroquinate synthase